MSSAASLNDSLRLIFPGLPEELVPAMERQRLSDTARMLAPIHCAGFECRLGAVESPVDLQQRILARDDEPARLARHIAAGPLASQPAWQKIRALCHHWQQEDSVLHTGVGGCWLEFDAGSSEPSVFLSLQPLLGLRYSGREVVGIASTVAEQLARGSLPQDVAAIVRSCVDECPEGAGATDLGFMLGRPDDAVRLVVGPLQPGGVADYLKRVGGLGEGPALGGLAVDEALAALPDSAEQILVSLDVGAAVLPRVGLEYFPGGQPGDEALWVELLDGLVAAGLCTAKKGAALLQWPGYLEPGNAEGPWPESLLAESLLRGVDQFSVLGRRLNHVKIVCRPRHAAEAKAYFGFGSLWLQPDGGQEEVSGGGPLISGEGPGEIGPETPLKTSLETAVEVALRTGVDFLLEARDPAGLWLDFESVMGGSDEWVSAYTGTILAALPTSHAQEAARQTWDSLCRRVTASGGWSYNPRLPADADATVWVLRLARALGSQDSETATRGERFSDQHVRPDGSVASYTAADLPKLQEFLGDGDMRGLCVGHDCVTAAAAVLPQHAHRSAEYLASKQHPGGWWEGYWWSDHEYATALAVDGLLALKELAATGELPDVRGELAVDGPPAIDRLLARVVRCVEAATAWAGTRVSLDGAVYSPATGEASPFATALCCRILLAPRMSGGVSASLTSAIEWLVRHQLRDGSWQESALMRVPPADSLAPEAEPEGTFFALDRRRIFTTATVLWTLGLALTHAGNLE